MPSGRAKYAKWKSVGGRIATVELRLDDELGDRIHFDCTGKGFYSQGYIEEVPALGYDDWKTGAAAGISFAFQLIGGERRVATVTKIEGLGTDTSPAAVGAAAVLAVFDALGLALPVSLRSRLDEMVFSGDLDLQFNL